MDWIQTLSALGGMVGREVDAWVSRPETLVAGLRGTVASVSELGRETGGEIDNPEETYIVRFQEDEVTTLHLHLPHVGSGFASSRAPGPDE